MDFALNNQQRLICYKIQPTNQLLKTPCEAIYTLNTVYDSKTHFSFWRGVI